MPRPCLRVATLVMGSECARIDLGKLPKSMPQILTVLSAEADASSAQSEEMERASELGKLLAEER